MFRWSVVSLILVGLACAQNSPSLLISDRALGNSASSSPLTPTASPTRGSGVLPAPDLPKLPGGKVTLLGGTIQSIDHVRDRLVLHVFQGGRMPVLFDERTRVFRDGKAVSLDNLQDGERAYVDTTLDGTQIFARSIRIAGHGLAGQSSGQIVDFRSESGELLVRDSLAPEPVKMHLAANANILQQDTRAAPSTLKPGMLVTLAFAPDNGRVPVVTEISILASPGSAYTFSGQIEDLDLHRGLMVLIDSRDHKSYDLYFDPTIGLPPNIKPGDNVTVQTAFDGNRYQSRGVTVNPATPQ